MSIRPLTRKNTPDPQPPAINPITGVPYGIDLDKQRANDDAFANGQRALAARLSPEDRRAALDEMAAQERALQQRQQEAWLASRQGLGVPLK